MKLLELINRSNLDMTSKARKARAQAMGFDTSQVWYHANTGGIEGEGFDDARLPAHDPDRPFNAHWFSHEPSAFAAYPSTGNTITPVYLALRKEASIGVWSKVTAQVHKAWDAGDKKRNASDLIREKLVSMGYTHAIRGREPIDAAELERTGETSFKTSTGTTITLKWEKLMLPGGQPEYTDEEMEIIKALIEAERMYSLFQSVVVDHVVQDKMTPEKHEQLKAKGVELKNEVDRLKPLSDAANERAWDAVNDNRKEVDSLEMYDSYVGHVTGYESLADYERMSPEKEDIAVLDPSIIRSIHAEFNPDEADSKKMMSSKGLNEVRGPHQKKELKLMLAGKKPFAMIELDVRSEEREAWERAVDSGKIIHIDGIDSMGGHNDYFVLPGEEWRAEMATEMYKEVKKHNNMTAEHHTLLGKLLGYSDADIRHFVTGRDKHGDTAYIPSPGVIMPESERRPWTRRPPTVGYHATDVENRDNIRLHGLDPKYGRTWEDGGPIFFSTKLTPESRSDIWKADLRGLDVEWDDTTWPEDDTDTWWFVDSVIVPDRLELVQKGKDGILGEAPIRDFDVQPSVSTSDTWGDRDQKRIASPEFETLARKKVKTGVPIDMVIIGLTHGADHSWMKDTKMSTEFMYMLEDYSGVVTPIALERLTGIKIVPATDAITAVFMSNTNDVTDAMPISPWMLCHRLAHSIMDAASKRDLGNDAFVNAYSFVNVPLEYMTMRSAQPGKVMSNTGERGVEALAQFLHDGKIILARVDEAKTLALGMEEMAVLTNGHEVYGDTGGDEDVAVQDLDMHMEDMESQLNISGKIMVEACIGKLVVAP